MKHFLSFLLLLATATLFAQAKNKPQTAQAKNKPQTQQPDWAQNADLPALSKQHIKTIERVFGHKIEVYFTFKIKSREEISVLTKIISIDGVKDNVITAIANKKQFARFLQLNYAYKIQPNANELQKVQTVDAKTMLKTLRKRKNQPQSDTNNKNNGTNATMTVWNTYPTYPAYEAVMQQFATDYPSICKLVTIATLPSGRKILALKISDNINTKEDEPAFLYTSSMHGDEIAGYVGMLHFIDYLLTNYNTDARATYLINNMEIWINPSANPDGTYAGGNTTVNGATRANANSIDLNRNYPDPQDGPHPDGNAYQPETVAFMALADTANFVMAANFHGGAEVANYPWDTKAPLPADTDWWMRESHKYADTAQVHSPAGYFTSVQANGITNGFAWYEVNGGRQDYMNYYKHCREFTVELSNTKILQPANLLNNFEYNYRSWLTYMEEALHGVHGIITDACTNQPIRARVTVLGHDSDSSEMYSAKPIGNYNRPIFAGTYTIMYSAAGYVSQTFNNITVTDGNATVQNVSLSPAVPTAAFTTASTEVCGNIATFTDATGSATAWQWSFGDGSVSTLQNPTHTYATSGTYTVALTATNCAGSNTLSQNNFITITLPTEPINTNATICAGSTATLSASANGNVNWYANATDAIPLFTGNTFTTPALNATTTYYTESELAGTTNSLGAANNTIGAGGFYTAATYHYLRFSATAAFKLLSVAVNANTAGNRTIQLRNSAGVVLQSATVNVPAGASRVALNFSVPSGTDLQLGVAGANNLYRNSAGASYPYTLAGIASITGNSANSAAAYYYFYNWELTKPCTSARIASTVTVNAAPTPVIMASGGVLSANVSGISFQWYEATMGSIAGATNATFTPTVSGNYYLIITNNGCPSAPSNTINVTITGTQSSAQTQATLRVYPNPAHDNCTLDLSAFANTPQTICVYNMLGAMIFTTTTTEKALNLNTQNWAKGNYIIKATSRNSSLTATITVE